MKSIDISELIGKTLIKIENKNNEQLFFHTSDNEIYKMYHGQECCESVTIEDIIGDIEDLIDSPLLVAEIVASDDEPMPEEPSDDFFRDECCLWTFYKFATRKGYVDIRWFGTSNGYYSVGVDIVKADSIE